MIILFRFQSFLVLCAVALLSLGLSFNVFAEEASRDFSDIPSEHEYAQAIDFLARQNIISGNPDGTFQPERSVNRAEVLKMAYLTFRAENFMVLDDSDDYKVALILSDAVDSSADPFGDVARSEWYYPYVAQAKLDGIVHGHKDGLYRPHYPVNLASLLKILMRTDFPDFYIYKKQEIYADVPGKQWFTKYFYFAEMLGILEPDADGKVYPEKELTRGEVADIIFKYVQAKEKVREGRATYYADYFHGRNTASGEPFDMNALTVAHKTLPFNVRVKVWNADNNKSVTVRVNDRGPFVKNVDFDLSKAAFAEIAPLGKGVTSVYWQFD